MEMNNPAAELLRRRCWRSSAGCGEGRANSSNPSHPVGPGTNKGRGGEEWTRIGCQAIGANVRQTKRVSPTLAAKVRLGV